MSAKILSGREISAEVRQELKQQVSKLKAKGLAPGLAMVRVGEDPASVSYVKQKGKTTEELGRDTGSASLASAYQPGSGDKCHRSNEGR
jgi:5,10-methylene-tetrahydrofolate dehydrogenase/methenyl tetrahydrofolate cyclohydrolase